MKSDTVFQSGSYSELKDDSVSTTEARHRLEDKLHSALKSRENTLINAPTSLGKSHTVATTAWRDYPELTGGEPVIHVHQTTDARQEAVKKSKNEDGVDMAVLKSRTETCPVARGDHDKELPETGGSNPSKWFRQKCNVEGMNFSKAHSYLSRKFNGLPCTKDGKCPAKKQFSNVRPSGEKEIQYDVLHMTAPFARLSWLIKDANLIFDEQPSYNLAANNLRQLRKATNELLHRRSDGDLKWSALMYAIDCDDEELLREIWEVLQEDVSNGWLFGYEESHTLAPCFGQALTSTTSRCGDRRRVGRSGDVSVVLDEKDEITRVHHLPDFSAARCVIGLDAFPVEFLWKMNTVRDLQPVEVLSPDERRLWRRQERGLEIRQVGNADRSYTREWKSESAPEKARALIRWLRGKYGDEFSTCIVPKSRKPEVEEMMRAAGIEDPTVMYYSNLKSRNKLKGESVGLLIGCIDPGDHPIYDDLAVAGLDAEPRICYTDDGEKYRAPDRGFVGPDAEAARQSLAAVRANNLTQGAGRYARKPGEDGEQAIVYVWSAALPDYYTDSVLETSYTSITETKTEIAEYVRESDSPVNPPEVSENCDIHRKTAWENLELMVEQGIATVEKGGTNMYRYNGGQLRPTMELSSE